MSPDCTCARCVSACKHKPGWFAPGQVELVAQHLGITLEELFKRYLGVDFWVGEPTTFVLAPAVVEMEAGKEYPFKPTGRCVFLTDDDRCSIHPVKPRECRETDSHQSKEANKEVKTQITLEWGEHQPQITALLGRKPELPGASIFDVLELLGGMGGS